jgi:hypothetical protein
MEPLIDDFMKPVSEPEEYVPVPDVVAWEILDNGCIVLEIFKRKNGTFGYRYNTWIAWRDAGGEVRSHSWRQKDPEGNLITDNISEACNHAVNHANEHGLSSEGNWNHVA